jgi:hypothetical protein
MFQAACKLRRSKMDRYNFQSKRPDRLGRRFVYQSTNRVRLAGTNRGWGLRKSEECGSTSSKLPKGYTACTSTGSGNHHIENMVGLSSVSFRTQDEVDEEGKRTIGAGIGWQLNSLNHPAGVRNYVSHRSSHFQTERVPPQATGPISISGSRAPIATLALHWRECVISG